MPRPRERTFQAEHYITMAPAVYIRVTPPAGLYLTSRRRITVIRKLEEISFCDYYTANLLLHASVSTMFLRASRRLKGQPPEGQGRRVVGSADSREAPPLGEASPPPGFARERSTAQMCQVYTVSTTQVVICVNSVKSVNCTRCHHCQLQSMSTVSSAQHVNRVTVSTAQHVNSVICTGCQPCEHCQKCQQCQQY